MRIIYFYQYFGTPKGGWSTRVYEMCRRWVDKGHKVTVITSVYDKSDLKPKGLVSRHNIEGIEVILINVKLSNKHGRLMRLYTFFLFALLSSWYGIILKYDRIVASSGPITIGIPGLIARYIRRKPMIFEVRDLWPDGAIELGLLKGKRAQKIAYWFEARCYKASRSVVALSPGMAASVNRRFPDVKTHIIPNASDIALFNDPKLTVELPDWAQGKRLFLYTGTLGVMDDCWQIIEAARVLQERNDTETLIVLIGEGKEKQAIMEKAESLGLKNVRFLGLLPKEQVVGWLKHAYAAFVTFKDIPVLQTSSPNKMFDAFAAGIPLVQVTQGWIKELFAKEHCGITVPQNYPELMADAVQQLSADPALRATLANNAARVAKEKFDRNKLAAEMLQIIIA